MRTSSSPSPWRAIPMFSVDARIDVSRKRRSQASTASQRSSSGVRFHRWHFLQTTQSRPFAESKASLRPTGNSSTTSLVPRGLLQNMQVWYMACQRSSPCLSKNASVAAGRRRLSAMAAISFRFFPRLLQDPEFAFEGTPLLLFVKRHFEGEPGGSRHVAQIRRATSFLVGFSLTNLGEKAVGVTGRLDLLHGVLDRSPRTAPFV